MESNRRARYASLLLGIAIAISLTVLAACASGGATPTGTTPAGTATVTGTGTPVAQGPVVSGLEINITDGKAEALTVIGNRDYFLDRLFVIADDVSTSNNGLDGIIKNSDFKMLDWTGTKKDPDMPWRSIWPYPVDPKSTNLIGQEFYRGSTWVNEVQNFTVQVLDASGKPIGNSIQLNSGRGDKRADTDSWSIRRFATIRYLGGVKLTDPNCSTATSTTCDIQASGPFTTEARM